MATYEMDLGRMLKRNQQEDAENLMLGTEMKEVVDLPHNVEMKELRSNAISATDEKSPKSINDSAEDIQGDEVRNVDPEWEKLNNVNQQKTNLRTGFLSFMRQLFK
jgi:hypothetical protein